MMLYKKSWVCFFYVKQFHETITDGMKGRDKSSGKEEIGWFLGPLSGENLSAAG